MDSKCRFPKAQNTRPKRCNRTSSLVQHAICIPGCSTATWAWASSSLFTLVSLYLSPEIPSSHSPLDLTRAPLLSRIMKMMKVSNQLCSTMRKQVFLRIHQDLPSPSSMLTWQHLNRWTQPVISSTERSDHGNSPA